MKVIIYLFFVCISSHFLTSCKDEKIPSTKEYFYSFISNENNITSYGQLNFNEIIKEIDYTKIPKLNLLISKELKSFSTCIDMEKPIYYANKGLIKKTVPEDLFLFITVKNKDILKDKLNSLGLYMEKNEKYNFTVTKNYTIGITNNLAIFHFSEKNKMDINKLFISCEQNNISTNKFPDTDELIPFTNIINLQELYKYVYKNEREPKHEKELKNSYLKTEISFNKGGVLLKIKNEFSNDLKKRMFFLNTNNPKFESFSGSNHQIGLSYNIDINKLENILIDYVPDYTEYIAPTNFAVQLALLSLGETPLSNLLGKKGTIIYSNKNTNEQIQACIELGKEKETIIDLVSPFLSFSNNLEVKFKKDVFICKSKNVKGELFFPTNQNKFGKDGVSGFVNFYEFTKDNPIFKEYPFLEALESINVIANNEEINILLQGKDHLKSLPNQILNIYINTFSQQIQNLSIN